MRIKHHVQVRQSLWLKGCFSSTNPISVTHHISRTEVKFTVTIVDTVLCAEAFVKRADLMLECSYHTHTKDNETSVGDGYLLRQLWYMPASAGDIRNSGSIPGLGMPWRRE